MTQMGDEMILDLAAKLESSLNKVAAKKEEKPKADEDDGEKDEGEDGDEEKECKKCGPDKKCSCFPNLKPKSKKKKATLKMINTLSKLASELDDMGVEEASNLVDDALRVIVKNISTES